MNAKQFEKLLIELDACSDGMEFARGKSLAVVWKTLVKADWMCWLLVKMANKPGWPSKRLVRLSLCDCAETSLPIYEKHYPNDNRPRMAIEVSRLYAMGKATDEELAAARAATWVASDAASATNLAASAAALAASAAALAASNAASDAASATDLAASAADSAAASYAAHLKMCKLVSKRVGKFKALGVK